MSQPKTQTVVLQAGKLKKREIKQLKKGAGPIFDQARVAAEGVAAAPEAIPVVIVYEQRPKKRRALLGALLHKR